MIGDKLVIEEHHTDRAADICGLAADRPLNGFVITHFLGPEDFFSKVHLPYSSQFTFTFHLGFCDNLRPLRRLRSPLSNIRLPGISVPCAFSEGMSVGMQLSART